MRYFVRVDDNPASKTYGTVMAVMRFDPETAKPELWRKDEAEWIDHPEVLNAFGLGGANDHFEVPEAFAVRALDAWKAGQKPPSVFEPGAGIVNRSGPTSEAMRIVRWD